MTGYSLLELVAVTATHKVDGVEVGTRSEECTVTTPWCSVGCSGLNSCLTPGETCLS